MIRKIKTLALSAVALIALTSTGNAGGGGTVFDSASSKAIEIFKNVKNLIFIMGGFGLVGMAVGAIFGRVNWKWFGALAFGLAIIAAAGAVIEYMTGGSVTSSELEDSFGN